MKFEGASMSELDIIIRGGMIIDGQRTPRYCGDIGIKNGRVEAITGVGGSQRKEPRRKLMPQD